MPFTKQGDFKKKVTDLPDRPSPDYTAADIKAHFQTPADELKATVNKLVDDLGASIGAGNIGAKKGDGATSNIQAVLDEKETKTTVNGINQRVTTAEENIATLQDDVSSLDSEVNNQGNRIDNIVASAGTSNTEIVDARYDSINEKTYNTLSDRLDNTTSQLADFAINPNAVGDGVADDSIAIQQALDTLPINTVAKGIRAILPSGHYKITSLNIPNGVVLEGKYAFDPINKTGTWLYCVDQVNPAIKLNSGSAIKNIAFYYPEQDWDSVNLQPLYVYPASIEIQEGAKRMLVQDVFFLNTYYAIDASKAHEFLILNNIQGYAIKYGLISDKSTDIDRYRTVHFNFNALGVTDNYGTVSSNLGKWTRTNGVAFTGKKLDWAIFNDCFAWGYRTTFKFTANELGDYPAGIHLNNCGADATGQILYQDAGFGVSMESCFGTCFNPFTDNVDVNDFAIEFEGVQDFSMDNCRFWGIDRSVVGVFGIAEVTSFSNNTFYEYGTKATTNNADYRAIVSYSGILKVNNNHFYGRNQNRVYGILFNSTNPATNISGNTYDSFVQYCITSNDADNFSISGEVFKDSPNKLEIIGNPTNYFYSSGVYSISNAWMLNPTPSGNIPNNSIFLDSTDNILKFKDSAGLIHNITLT